jgi:hypothetical protein
MVKVELKNKIYLLPVSSEELSLEQGMQLLASLKLEDLITADFKRSILAVLLQCEVELLIDIPDYQIEILYSKIPYLHDKQTFGYAKTFKINNIVYGLIDFDTLTVREFDELSKYLEEENENIDKILSIIYRKIKHREQNLKNILINVSSYLLYKGKVKPKVYKSYSLINENTEPNIFRNNFSYSLGRGGVLHFLEWKAEFEKEFWQIYEEGKDPDAEEDYDPFTKLEDEQPKRKELPNLGEIWGLFHLIFEICNGDKKQIDYWYDKPIRELFVHCIYVKQRNIYLEKMNNNGG